MKIVSARITAMPVGICDPLPAVFATFEGGAEKKLFDYFPDELSFTPKEFVGLTEAQAHDLKSQKDRSYLKS